jgi:hypothetical protein
MSKTNKYLKEQEAKKKQRATQAFREGKGRINYSGTVSEKKATRMKKKATKLSAASKKAHNTSGMASAKDVANRAKYNTVKKKKEAAKRKY